MLSAAPPSVAFAEQVLAVRRLCRANRVHALPLPLLTTLFLCVPLLLSALDCLCNAVRNCDLPLLGRAKPCPALPLPSGPRHAKAVQCRALPSLFGALHFRRGSLHSFAGASPCNSEQFRCHAQHSLPCSARALQRAAVPRYAMPWHGKRCCAMLFLAQPVLICAHRSSATA